MFIPSSHQLVGMFVITPRVSTTGGETKMSVTKDAEGSYTDPDRLEAAYNCAGTVEGTARIFSCSPTTARKYLRRFGLYESPTEPPAGERPPRAWELESADPEDLGL